MASVTTEELFLIGYLLPKLYEKLLTPQEKESWKSQHPIHHGEAGVVVFVLGLLTKSPRLATFGLGLAVDDWNDRNKWFKDWTF